MSIIIEDGAGNGYKAEIKSNKKLATESVVVSRHAYIADVDENSYLLSTGGFINLTTTDTETGIFYVKYTGNGHLHLTNLRCCGTVAQKWLIYKNPTGGTLISNQSGATENNTNLTSSNLLSCNCYKGANGDTLTGGSVIENFINNMGHSTEEFDGSLILGKNDSIALTCEVSAAGYVCIRILCFEDAGSVL